VVSPEPEALRALRAVRQGNRRTGKPTTLLFVGLPVRLLPCCSCRPEGRQRNAAAPRRPVLQKTFVNFVDFVRVDK
jgi:hypothetical protein